MLVAFAVGFSAPSTAYADAGGADAPESVCATGEQVSFTCAEAREIQAMLSQCEADLAVVEVLPPPPPPLPAGSLLTSPLVEVVVGVALVALGALVGALAL